ncbi:MAG: GntR family transcriptional regulator [Coriobacteriaceae bacterium]|nr:GntR family transcriptional regulator [Coriobacteriaceae bacterium]
MSRVPPRDRAVEGVRWYIWEYGLKAGDKLPPEREFCEALGVSRTALRAAITRLESSGDIERRHGSGTYVGPSKPLCVFQETCNYTYSVRRAGRVPSSRVVRAQVVAAPPEVADEMGIPEGSQVFELCRIRLVDSSPASIETAHVNYEFCAGIESCDFATQSLYDVLEETYDVHVRHGVERVSIARLNADEAALLGVEASSPAYCQRTFESDPDGRPIECCTALLLPSKYRYADNGEKCGVQTKVGFEWLMR